MKHLGRCAVIVFALRACLFADSNLQITDVGLHGYGGTLSAVRLLVRNPSPQAQAVHLQIIIADKSAVTDSVTADMNLNGAEERQVELPILLSPGETKITADAFAGGSAFGHDTYVKSLSYSTLIALMCADQSVCQSLQSQIEFSGSIEERANKNRNFRFEVINDPREDWWAYNPARAIVLATPLTGFSSQQRSALEGYLRRGGLVVLVEDKIEDPDFLSAYRKGPPKTNGDRVAKGRLFRVTEPNSDQLGEIFDGRSRLTDVPYAGGYTLFQRSLGLAWLDQRFAATLDFPKLRWILIGFAAYILIIGVVNFAVLRRLHHLELGWISMCGLALLFAGGFYLFSASRQPKQFRLDNLAAYYLDSRSPLAAADYQLRISAPKRQELNVSVADSALFTDPMPRTGELNSQLWTDINRQVAQVTGRYDIHLGPPRQIQLSLLKWSFTDLSLEGLRDFPGTVHFVGTKRLRNDTGLNFSEAVYYDGRENMIYTIGGLGAGQEVDLATIPPTPIRRQEQRPWASRADPNKTSLSGLALDGLFPFGGGEQVFAGLSAEPELAVGLSVDHQEKAHSLISVTVEEP